MEELRKEVSDLIKKRNYSLNGLAKEAHTTRQTITRARDLDKTVTEKTLNHLKVMLK